MKWLKDFQLYLTASNTTRKYLETDGVSLKWFAGRIKKSKAGRKVVILDACHSGKIHNTMNNLILYFSVLQLLAFFIKICYQIISIIC